MFSKGNPFASAGVMAPIIIVVVVLLVLFSASKRPSSKEAVYELMVSLYQEGLPRRTVCGCEFDEDMEVDFCPETKERLFNKAILMPILTDEWIVRSVGACDGCPEEIMVPLVENDVFNQFWVSDLNAHWFEGLIPGETKAVAGKCGFRFDPVAGVYEPPNALKGWFARRLLTMRQVHRLAFDKNYLSMIQSWSAMAPETNDEAKEVEVLSGYSE